MIIVGHARQTNLMLPILLFRRSSRCLLALTLLLAICVSGCSRPAETGETGTPPEDAAQISSTPTENEGTAEPDNASKPSVDWSARYALGGVVEVDGDPYVVLIDRDTLLGMKVTRIPNNEGISLVELRMQPRSADTTALIRFGEDEALIGYNPELKKRAAAHSGLTLYPNEPFPVLPEGLTDPVIPEGLTDPVMPGGMTDPVIPKGLTDPVMLPEPAQTPVALPGDEAE